jgi:tRNA-Thr(GGU) m(6)t(6)A37 methyltransferase TsaA
LDKEIVIRPIGLIHTPHKEPSGTPIQGKFSQNIIGTAEIFPKYQDGLKDIDGFSHVYLIYHFDRAKEEKLVGRPYLEDEEHGIFAIRSPARPNHIGISIVKIEKVEGNLISFSEVDILDQTPLIDIKPYVSYFDSREQVKNGWVEKHFSEGKIPRRTRLD